TAIGGTSMRPIPRSPIPPSTTRKQVRQDMNLPGWRARGGGTRVAQAGGRGTGTTASSAASVGGFRGAGRGGDENVPPTRRLVRPQVTPAPGTAQRAGMRRAASPRPAQGRQGQACPGTKSAGSRGHVDLDDRAEKELRFRTLTTLIFGLSEGR